ncbi:MAG: biopolymer transporter ExbD [Myxococcaceae bacterium]|nr:biopolymer transporter ExbD [Myxococcaceae bacterium]MBH2006178.1 biopolymer transporter ExbD [Myxococcaceae bacterium]
MRRGGRRQRSTSEELPEPEILPMMNVLFMLVMVLMGMSAFLPIGVIRVDAPQFGGVSDAVSPEASSGPVLDLMVIVLSNGINLQVAGKTLGTSEEPLFPKTPQGYDFEGLRQKFTELKLDYPNENRMILMADSDVIYNDITHIMDSARPMFEEVAFVPGVVP